MVGVGAKSRTFIESKGGLEEKDSAMVWYLSLFESQFTSKQLEDEK